jgi:hypothetical protein
MMIDYQIQPSTRRCHATGRELSPGERCYSVLLDESGKLVRHDYAPEAWQGPPEGAYGFWAGRVPPANTRRRIAFDDELLLECFTRLHGQEEPARRKLRYVMALMLLRRRRLVLDEARTEAGHEVLVLRCGRTGVRHPVVNPGLDEEELASVQDDVFRALGWE